MSTSDAGSWTYLITEPRMKQFFTDCCAREQRGWRWLWMGVYTKAVGWRDK